MAERDHGAGLFEVIAGEAIMGILVFNGEDLSESSGCVYINRVAREALELGESRETRAEGALDQAIDRAIDNSHSDAVLSEFFPADTRSGKATLFSLQMVATEGLFQNVLMRKRDGHVIVANISVKHVVLNPGSDLRLVMFQDITVQNKLQRELEVKQAEIKDAYTQVLEQNRQLLELDQAKDKFIALTTHELRTPLSAIVATTDVLQLKLYESEEQKEEFIKMIHEQGLHLNELLNDILDFAKIRAGKMEFFVESVQLAPIVAKIATSFETMAAQAKISIEMIGERDGSAYADTLRLKEVINNVVNNAIKYNRSGGTVKISFSALSDKFRRITVTDSGPGIAADKLHHVFNEFETVGHVSQHHKGTGLGMPISKRLMNAMGGDLTLASQVGVGSSFFIDLPLEKVLKPEMYGSRRSQQEDQLGDLLSEAGTPESAQKTGQPTVRRRRAG